MIDNVRLAWRLLRDERVSGLKFLLPALLAMYVFSPVDMVPDLFLGIGQVDDAGAMIVAAMLMIRLLPKVRPGWNPKRIVGLQERPLSNCGVRYAVPEPETSGPHVRDRTNL